MNALRLDPRRTALVLIDLQNGIVARETVPYPAADVVRRGNQLARVFRSRGAMVVYIRVDLADFIALPVDTPGRDPNAPPPPASASELTADAGFEPGDLVVTKRHWGAFAGTTLESALRQRGIDTVVLTGISTNAGVESTARQGTGLGFAFVIVEDACASSLGADAHRFAFQTIFPRLARVRTTDEVIAALAPGETA